MGFLLLLLLSLFSLTNAESLYSPFGKKAYLTSSFGENRGTRYHAGIDYSTEMEEGWAIFAPENGVVEELRVSPYGYGKVLYFKGESGKTWVFAHQSGFTSTLDSMVLAKQKELEKNDVKILPNLSFKKGDTLSFAGSSGIGNPHLHLELREGPYGLYSPCQSGVACSDTIPPFVFACATWDKRNFKLTSLSQKNNQCLERPSSKGAFFAAFKIADYSRTPLENPMSIRGLRLSTPRETIYEKIQDTLSYKNMIKIRNELLFAEEADTAGDWHYIETKIPSNADSLFLEVEDFKSNITSLKFALKDSCSSNISVARTLYQDSLLYTFLSRPFVSFKNCQGPVSLFSEKGKLLEKDLCKVYTSDIQVSSLLKKYPKAFKIAFLKDTIFVRSFGKSKTSWDFFSKEESIEIKIPALEEVSWNPVFAYRKRTTDSLSYLEFHPKGLHFEGNLQVCVKGKNWEAPFYYLGETTRKWFYFSKQKKSKKGTCVSMNEIRDIASIIDTLAPLPLTPYFAKAPVAGIPSVVLRIPIVEKGSGIKNGNAIKATLESGEWIYAEYDSEPNEIVIESRHLPKGTQKIFLWLEDEVGNQETYPISLPNTP